eukprot:7384820-Prymnesium_polylepis.1
MLEFERHVARARSQFVRYESPSDGSGAPLPKQGGEPEVSGNRCSRSISLLEARTTGISEIRRHRYRIVPPLLARSTGPTALLTPDTHTAVVCA